MIGEPISEAQVQELADVIRRAKAAEAASAAEADARTTFCKVWPSVRGGLEALRLVLGSVPGVSAIAGAAISIVIAAGDAAKQALCSDA